MSQIKSLKIGEREYKLVVMSPWRGATYAAKVGGLLTKALAGEAGEAKDLADMKSQIAGGGVSDELIQKIISMITRIIPHIDPDKFSQLAQEAFKHSEVAIWAIKENCSGFFVGGGAGWSALASQFLPSKSPTDG